MAVTKFDGGWKLTAVGDVATPASGRDILVHHVIIVKTNAGTVTFKDGSGNVVLVTGSLGTNTTTQIDIGIQSSGFEYDATSLESAVIYVFGVEVGL